MENIPAINAGKAQVKRYHHNMSVPVETTSDIGFTYPFKTWFVPADTHVSVSHKAKVRLSPMPVPTNGRIDLKTDYVFVPVSEICPVWESWIHKQTYRGASANYIPSSLWNVPNNVFLWCCLFLSRCSVYKNEGATITSNRVTSVGSWSLVTDVDDVQDYFDTMIQTELPQYYSLSNLISGTGYPTFITSGDDVVTDDSADFIFFTEDDVYGFKYCFKLSMAARHFRKILIGLGYKLNFSNYSKNILPLLAYYKAWFETYYPQRNEQYMDTAAFKLINILTQTNDGINSHKDVFASFIKSLMMTYYVSDPDFVSIHISNLSNLTTGTQVNYVDADNQTNSLLVPSHQQGEITTSDTVTSDNVRLLDRVTKLINKNTVIGKDVQQLSKVRFGYEIPNTEPRYIGGDNVECFVSEVMSNSEGTSDLGELRLGDYAGKSVGLGESRNYSFDSSQPGFLICLGTVVPVGSEFYQGDEYFTSMLLPEDYPQSEYDAIGYEVTPKNLILSDLPVATYLQSPEVKKGFGFVPRYSAAKIARPIVNGDMSLRSTRDSYDPYHLMRKITTDIDYGTLVQMPDFTYLTASPYWRFIGKYRNLGNWSRIFYNQPVVDYRRLIGGISPFENFDERIYGYDDDFIIDSYFNCTFINNLKSLSDSFYTDEDNNAIKVEHS